ncbi:hypothetical protein SALBM311S_04863 [Streptomyces alboniger]
MGRLCVEAVLRKMRQVGPERGTTLVPTRLVVRDSTGPGPESEPGSEPGLG